MPDGPLFLADTAMNVDPSAEDLVKITEASVDLVARFGIEPKVALLSHSNFGTSNAGSAKKMRKASELLREKYPELQLDGEMHVLSALNPALRDTIYSQANLQGRANVLVMPNLDSAQYRYGSNPLINGCPADRPVYQWFSQTCTHCHSIGFLAGNL